VDTRLRGCDIGGSRHKTMHHWLPAASFEILA